MTAQMPDTVKYRRKEYAIAGVSGDGLFDPADHEVTTHPISSACWRGFICEYAVSDRTLWLKRLTLSVKGKAPVLFGITPNAPQRTLVFQAVYENIGHKVPYTGGLLLGRNFVDELYVHMGFHPAWKYREVHELVFDEGTLTEEADRSEEMARCREDIGKESLKPEPEARRAEIMQWIARCFSQDYERRQRT
jgi:hypothetical protein